MAAMMTNRSATRRFERQQAQRIDEQKADRMLNALDPFFDVVEAYRKFELVDFEEIAINKDSERLATLLGACDIAEQRVSDHLVRTLVESGTHDSMNEWLAFQAASLKFAVSVRDFVVDYATAHLIEMQHQLGEAMDLGAGFCKAIQLRVDELRSPH